MVDNFILINWLIPWGGSNLPQESLFLLRSFCCLGWGWHVITTIKRAHCWSEQIWILLLLMGCCNNLWQEFLPRSWVESAGHLSSFPFESLVMVHKVDCSLKSIIYFAINWGPWVGSMLITISSMRFCCDNLVLIGFVHEWFHCGVSLIEIFLCFFHADRFFKGIHLIELTDSAAVQLIDTFERLLS